MIFNIMFTEGKNNIEFKCSAKALSFYNPFDMSAISFYLYLKL